MKKHIGERKKTRYGFTAEVKEWYNRENVCIEILETGERQLVSYIDFKKGRVLANTFRYPVNQVPLHHAVPITITIITFILAAIGGLIYWLCA